MKHQHQNPTDCQVLLALTGTKEAIIDELELILRQIQDTYGKPYQGITFRAGITAEVITPVWRSKQY